jgi:hypothetical protein
MALQSPMDPKFTLDCPTRDIAEVMAIAEYLATNAGNVKQSEKYKEHDQ